MRDWIKQALRKWAIRIALNKLPPERAFSIAGEAAMGNDYYGAYLEHESLEQFTVKGMGECGLSGLHFGTNNGKGVEASLPFRFIGEYKFSFRHWYKDYVFSCFSPALFVLRHYTKFNQFCWLFDALRQGIYNFKDIARQDRMYVLKFILNNTVKDRKYKASVLDVMISLHGTRWAMHPKCDDLMSYYQLVLDSLVASGELSKFKNSYQLEAKALTTLDGYEEHTSQHADSINSQRRIVSLTWVLAIAAVAQVFVALWGLMQ